MTHCIVTLDDSLTHSHSLSDSPSECVTASESLSVTVQCSGSTVADTCLQPEINDTLW